MKKTFLLLLIFCASFSLSADSPLAEPAEQAQNIIDKTIDRMGYSWGKMKEHFSKGNDKVREKADSAAKKTIQKGKYLKKKIPGKVF